MRSLHTAKIRYKGVTLRQFMDLLINNYEATPEERANMRRLSEAPWDPNQHIETLYDSLKTNLETLAEMKNDVPYPTVDFIETGYMAVRQTKQFTKACSYWK